MCVCSQIMSMPPDTMLNKLRSRAGKWHYLAKLFTPLYQNGIDNATIDQMTGITPVVQVRHTHTHTRARTQIDSAVTLMRRTQPCRFTAAQLMMHMLKIATQCAPEEAGEKGAKVLRNRPALMPDIGMDFSGPR